MDNYTQLSHSERCQINAWANKQSIKETAKQLNRHRSTLYRELKRNKKDTLYDPGVAHKLAKERRAGGAKSKFETNPELKNYVLEKLNQFWSPEEISGRMKHEKRNYSISTESIYQFVYRDLSKKLYELLPTKRKKRNHRYQRKQYHTTIKSDLIQIRNIKNRPPEAISREHVGHWEADTIRFPKTQHSCITTLVDRKSRYVTLHLNPDGKTKTVVGGIINIIKNSNNNYWHTITFDQGSEFMNFPVIEHFTTCKTYFCDPHSPWQRPSNENTNGRIRRFLPKNFLVDTISNDQLQIISDRMNNTPRKCLGYLTPREVFMQLPCRTSS